MSGYALVRCRLDEADVATIYDAISARYTYDSGEIGFPQAVPTDDVNFAK
ncbi:MAG: hypothetical protein RSC68_26975 [Acinetobacter sp.]